MRNIPVEVSNLQQFFTELTPRLEAARELDEKMNRVFAHRFNVLDYLRTDELGLSRIIADLFNPRASHGQGTFFLKSFLSMLGGGNDSKIYERWPDFDSIDVQVYVEKAIKSDRRIDIYVTIKSQSDTYCLAIENKPYAADQERQIADYLEHLNKYEGKFLLIYLPSRGQRPSESSLPRLEYEKWKGRFMIMAYYNESEIDGTEIEFAEIDNTEDQSGSESVHDELADFHIPFSLADWFSECRKDCEVDRLRSFLRDTQDFCKRRFGGQSMANDSGIEAVENLVFSDRQKYLTIAHLISNSWPRIRDRVCAEYFDYLAKRIKGKIEENYIDGVRDGIEIWSDYGGGKKHSCIIKIYRKSWKEYISNNGSKISRTTICLENRRNGPQDWTIGVRSPLKKSMMNESDKSRRQLIEDAMQTLPGRTDDWWPRRSGIEISKHNWNNILPELHTELEKKDGKITDNFVDEMVKIATTAIPIIDEIEGVEN